MTEQRVERGAVTDLRIEPVDPEAEDSLQDWRHVHNLIVPPAAMSFDEVRERSGRNRLENAYLGDVLVGCSTVRPPQGEDAVATVIARVLPEFRRRGYGAALYGNGRARACARRRCDRDRRPGHQHGRAAVRRGPGFRRDRALCAGRRDRLVDHSAVAVVVAVSVGQGRTVNSGYDEVVWKRHPVVRFKPASSVARGVVGCSLSRRRTGVVQRFPQSCGNSVCAASRSSSMRGSE